MPFDRSSKTYPAPPEIVQLADKYTGGFQTHLHVLSSTEEILSEEHRLGVIAECDAWLKKLAAGQGTTTHDAREIERIRRWANSLR